MDRNSSSQKIKRAKAELGSTLVMSFVILFFLLVWGMLVVKIEGNYSTRATLTLDVVSASNAASNASPVPAQMFEVACNHLRQTINFGPGGCDPAFFPPVANSPVNLAYNNVQSQDGTFQCKKIDFRYDPGLLTAVQLTQRELCIDITECENLSGFIIPWVTNEPYKFGASACSGLKPAAVMMALDMSQKMHELHAFYQRIPPAPFLDRTLTPYTGLSVANNTLMRENSLPMVYDSYLPTLPAQFGLSPAGIYTFPFSTKEVSTIAGISNNWGTSPPPVHTNLIASMPLVVPQTTTVNPGLSTITQPDPIQYMPFFGQGNGGATADVMTWTTAGSSANFRWRHGVLTMNELSHRCFGPRKLWTQRIAQQFMYMLDNYQIPFGALTYSNWIIGLMPYIPYHHRLDATWPAAAGVNLRTLNLPLMGPDPTLLAGLPGADPKYIDNQFGNLNNPAVTPGILDRTTNFSLIYQPMSICARETDHQYLAGQPTHVYTALPNPFDLAMPVSVPNTSCGDPTQNGIPTMDAVKSDAIGSLGYDFIFRSRPMPPAVAAWQSDALPLPNTAPTALNIYSGDCFGDRQSNASGNAAPPADFPADDLGAGAPSQSICGNNGANRLLSHMRRDRQDAINIVTAAGTTLNMDDVRVQDVTAPYRVCRDTTTPAAMESTLASLNVSLAVSTLRSGGFTKSGWPLNMNQGVMGATHSGTNPTAAARQRYFSLPTDWNPSNAAQSVYPVHEPVNDALTSGALLNMDQILSDPTWVPDPTQVRRIVVLFSDGNATLSMQEAIAGSFDGAWFPPDPIPAELPVGTPGSTSGPFSIASNESLQLIHSMAQSGIMVVVVSLDDTAIGSPTISNPRLAFSAGLRKPIGEDVGGVSNTQYRFAVCKPCGSGYPGWSAPPALPSCNTPLPGEPAITSTSPDTCFNYPPAKNIYEIKVTRQPGEAWSAYQARMFQRVTVDLNRIINKFTLTK